MSALNERRHTASGDVLVTSLQTSTGGLGPILWFQRPGCLPGYGRLVVRIAVIKLLWQCGAQARASGRAPENYLPACENMAKMEPTNQELDRLASTRIAFPKRARPQPFWATEDQGLAVPEGRRGDHHMDNLRRVL